MSYEAVILAAGIGSRMGARGRATPKALLPLGPRTVDDPEGTCLLRRQAELLHAAGVAPIVVVVGALWAAIAEAARGWAVPLRFVHNTTPDMRRSGSLQSFQFALRAGLGLMRGARQTLLLDADIVYERSVLTAMLEAPEDTTLLYRAGKRADDEQVCVYGSPAAPRFLGKGLRPLLVDDAPCLGEAIGIVKLAPRDHEVARATVDWMLGDPDAPADASRARAYGPGGRATEHEELSQRLMHLGRMRAVGVPEAMCFMECDDESDYAAVRALYPRILARDAGHDT